MIGIAMVIFSAQKPIMDVAGIVVFQGLTVLDLVAWGLAVVGFTAPFGVFLRLKGITAPLYIYTVAALVLTISSASLLTKWQTFAVMTLHIADYAAVIMRGTLVDRRDRMPDLVVPAVMGAFALLKLWGWTAPGVVLWLALGYLAVRVLWRSGRVLWALRHQWVWWNPPASS